MEAIFKSVEYEVRNENIRITVTIDSANRVTLKTHNCATEFKFIGSNKEMVRKIGELLIEASRLADVRGHLIP